jgi:hypothetical protein
LLTSFSDRNTEHILLSLKFLAAPNRGQRQPARERRRTR